MRTEQPDEPEDLVARRELCDPRPDGLDHAGEVDAERAPPGPSEAGEQAPDPGRWAPDVRVGLTDGRGADVDQHLTGGRHGPFDLLDVEDVGWPVSILDDGTHQRRDHLEASSSGAGGGPGSGSAPVDLSPSRNSSRYRWRSCCVRRASPRRTDDTCSRINDRSSTAMSPRRLPDRLRPLDDRLVQLGRPHRHRVELLVGGECPGEIHRDRDGLCLQEPSHEVGE